MRRLFVAALVLAIAVAGCGSSRSGQVRVADPLWPGEILFELNADAEEKQVVVRMLSGEEMHAVHLRASSDSTVWYDPDDPGSRTAVLTSEIAWVRFDGGRQATRLKEGAIIGAALAVLPTVIGVAGQPETAGVGIFTGLLCGGAGGALGALIGHQIKYEVEGTVFYELNRPSPSASGASSGADGAALRELPEH